MAPPLVSFAVPTYGVFHANWVAARLALGTPLGASAADQWLLGPDSVADKRNAAVRNALAQGARYLFFIGDDTIPPSYAFIQMWNKMKFNSDVHMVSGVYFSRSFPPQPMLWRGYMEGSYYDWHVNEFFKVDWAGCDCLLLDLDIFRPGAIPGKAAIPEPWFSQDYVFSAMQNKPIDLATEDIYFFEKAKAHGYDLWIDSGIQCVHQDRNTGAQFYLPPDWPQMIPGSDLGKSDPDYLIADLGCGTSSPYTKHTLVRFDIDESVNPDVRCDLHDIPEPDCKYDEVWSRHSLEHFLAAEAPGLVREWSRILKIGGTLKINVPSIEAAMRLLLDPDQDAVNPAAREYAYWQLYGAQKDQWDVHKNGFTERSLRNLVLFAWGDGVMHAIGMDMKDEGEIRDGVGCFDPDGVTVTSDGTNLQLIATKVRHPKPAIIGPEGRYATIYRTEKPADMSGMLRPGEAALLEAQAPETTTEPIVSSTNAIPFTSPSQPLGSSSPSSEPTIPFALEATTPS